MRSIKEKVQFWVEHHPVYASILAGFLFGFSFPPLPFPFPLLIWLAVGIWMEVARQARSLRQAISHVFYGLLFANLIVSYWLMMATVGGGIAAIVAKAVVMSLMLTPFLWLCRVLKTEHSLWYFLLPLAWIFAEGIDFFWDLSYPWLLLGNAWADQAWSYQYIRYTSVLGLSAWVSLGGIITHRWLFVRPSPNIKMVPLPMVLGIWALPLLASISVYVIQKNSPHEAQEWVDILIIQPNHDSYATYNGYESYQQSLEDLLNQTEEALDAETDVVYWPENALDPYIVNIGKNTYEQQVQEAVDAWGIPLITGVTIREYYNPAKDSLPAIVRDRASERPWKVFNAAAGFYPQQEKQIYKKMRLVPLVEKLPFGPFLVRTGLFGVDWESWTLFGRGEELTQFPVHMNPKGRTKAPALICYDSAYPELFWEQANPEAGFFAIITNDGWWGNSSGHVQHFVLSKLRAVESGKYIARAANNGISGIITPWGNVLQETQYWTKASIRARIPVQNP